MVVDFLVDKMSTHAYNEHMNNYSYVRRIIMCAIDKCDETCTHENIIHNVEDKMPTDEVLCDLAELFKVFGDSTRVKILYALFESEMCVCDIAQLISMTQSAVSHQLRILKQARLVKYRRDGKSVLYSLDDEHIQMIFNQALAHISE